MHEGAGLGRGDSSQGRAEKGRPALAACRSRPAPLDGPSLPLDRSVLLHERLPSQPRPENAHAVHVRAVAAERRETLGDPHALLDGRAITEPAERFSGVKDAVERALLARAEERDPVRLPSPCRGAARETRERSQPHRGGGHGEEPEPAGMAERRRVSLSPRAYRLARIVVGQRPVHHLDVRGPWTERLDRPEHVWHHHREILPGYGVRFCGSASSARASQRSVKTRTLCWASGSFSWAATVRATRMHCSTTLRSPSSANRSATRNTPSTDPSPRARNSAMR